MAARGKRAAFGDGRRIVWAPQDYEIFRLNPNVAFPGEEAEQPRLFPSKLDWIAHYRGHRLYGHVVNGRWRFVDFECPPGEVVFDADELAFAAGLAPGRAGEKPFIVVEPRVKPTGACDGSNKQWPPARYAALAEALKRETGLRVVQFVPPRVAPLLAGVDVLRTPTFRHALAALTRAALYIGPEGGLHHGAAAVARPAVVIFGGFNTPRSTGYAWHENLTVGEPCGTIAPCAHCRKAMASIGVDQVLEAALRQLQKGTTCPSK